MIKRLFAPKEEDICPNCGTACFATDVLCPNCGKNLDELFEQLPREAFEIKPFITLQKEHKLLLKWILATSIGFALGKVLLSSLALTFVPFIYLQSGFDLFGIMLGVASGIATGISVGVLQWLILRNSMLHNWWWMIVTPFGMVSGSILESLFFELEHHLPPNLAVNIYPIDFWIGIFIYGVAIGLSQSIILRQHIPKTWIWVIANGFGWALAIVIGEDVVSPIFYPVMFMDLDFIQYSFDPYAEMAIHGTVGLVVGIITGILLLWMLQRNRIMIREAT